MRAPPELNPLDFPRRSPADEATGAFKSPKPAEI